MTNDLIEDWLRGFIERLEPLKDSDKTPVEVKAYYSGGIHLARILIKKIEDGEIKNDSI